MQQRTLIRTRSLPAFRSALITQAVAGGPAATLRRLVVVPTAAAGALLGQAIELASLIAQGSAVLLPSFVTRDELMARLHAALSGAPPRLTSLERLVLFERAARRTADTRRGGAPPFPIRPGLVAAMLDLHDQLARRQRPVRRFVRALFDDLRVERGTDQGSESLIAQTCFLGFAFLAYRRAAQASGGCDEADLHRRLLAEQPALPFDELLVAVADQPADVRGLWPADFDLVGRLSAIRHISVVLTDETHDAGFRERLEQELPGIVEARHDAAPRPAAPILLGPPARAETAARPGEGPGPFYVARDREEELRDVARLIVERAEKGVLTSAVAVVSHRPLPYLHVARQVLTDAGVPYRAFDALPLAAEPVAALVDLLLETMRTGGDAESVVAITRSPLVTLPEGDVASAVREACVGVARLASGSAQVRGLVRWLRDHERPAPGDAAWRGRAARARAGVIGALEALASALASHDDVPRGPEALAGLVRHALESRTLAPDDAGHGVAIVDAVAARFGDFDHVHLVGLVETDWPERPARSIFYPPSLLTPLSFPSETDQVAAARGAFADLLGLAAETTSLHAFQLEGDAFVGLSSLLEAVRGRDSVPHALPGTPRFPDEVFAGPFVPVGAPRDVIEWLDARRARPPLSTPAYSGRVGPRAPEAYRVSRVDRYVACPFKYFAEAVLGLEEPRGVEVGLSPRDRGLLVHDIFERFYREWDAGRGGAITHDQLPDALTMFRAVALARLAQLPTADRVLEERRLLGSIASRGVADRVFELEADAGGQIARRLLEQELSGTFEFQSFLGRVSRINVRGKADRIDVFEDGGLRVVDYKLNRVPNRYLSVQVGVYAHCARQFLEAQDGLPHEVRSAQYISLGAERQAEASLGRDATQTADAVRHAAERFRQAVGAIEAGEFPARPHALTECGQCGFAAVCRKEYPPEADSLEGEDDAAAVV